MLNYAEKYREQPPVVEINYTICHQIIESDTADESIIRLLPFLGMDILNETRCENGEDCQYDITAVIKVVCALDAKALGDYRHAVAAVTDYNGYLTVLKSFVSRYSWTYYNGASNAEAGKKDAVGIFDIRFIGAERTSEAVSKETRREIDLFAKDQSNALALAQLRDDVSLNMKELLKPALERLSTLFENENNEIGLSRGNVSISHDLRPNISVSEAYITEVRDTTSDFVVPIDYNGLGYNNLISIYMLVKLTEIRRGRDFRILCLEEPEAHLHPAMQYKLFKYLRTLDETDKLNQQIFVTTHSNNISAVAGIDNMYMLSYERTNGCSDCKQQSLAALFAEKMDAKVHLSKFLDVTRSDMLYADKVILVEGIAEKLLLPLFMDKCGCSYEDDHISIIEIGGKHFEHFVELFNGNVVVKKVLCITDRDFTWTTNGVLATRISYDSFETAHIKKLTERFTISNFSIKSQKVGGTTFEDELFLSNIDAPGIAVKLMKLVANETVTTLLDNHQLSFTDWDSNRPTAANSVVSKNLDIIKTAIQNDDVNKEFYKRLFFAELFLYYAKGSKGDLALDMLTDDEIVKDLVVPQYIKEGLEWLKQ